MVQFILFVEKTTDRNADIVQIVQSPLLKLYEFIANCSFSSAKNCVY